MSFAAGLRVSARAPAGSASPSGLERPDTSAEELRVEFRRMTSELSAAQRKIKEREKSSNKSSDLARREKSLSECKLSNAKRELKAEAAELDKAQNQQRRLEHENGSLQERIARWEEVKRVADEQHKTSAHDQHDALESMRKKLKRTNEEMADLYGSLAARNTRIKILETQRSADKSVAEEELQKGYKLSEISEDCEVGREWDLQEARDERTQGDSYDADPSRRATRIALRRFKKRLEDRESDDDDSPIRSDSQELLDTSAQMINLTQGRAHPWQ
ncbi:hypothetical protein CBOM_03559 [Ceraceosorus bombacis]|uniref:Uncharacterized protein n=1 Tax=Ceraceosorus bombacis TaxID=401625 RepID=A0A0P1BGJ3_9BASI|nr:hypothetical protein CBOM_03559 [Ceraceosorus bombacis]